MYKRQTLGFGAIVFTQRAVFFAPIGEAKIAENKTGAAMALGSFIGYAPAMFCFSLYGYILDLNPGIIGYKIVFGIMACFAFSGAVVSVMLVKRISQRKNCLLYTSICSPDFYSTRGKILGLKANFVPLFYMQRFRRR